jgi:hypothetical protein
MFALLWAALAMDIVAIDAKGKVLLNDKMHNCAWNNMYSGRGVSCRTFRTHSCFALRDCHIN